VRAGYCHRLLDLDGTHRRWVGPENVPVAAYTVSLGAIHAVLGLIWFILLISATRPLVELLRRPAVMKMLDRITGGIFIAFGARLALASNARWGLLLIYKASANRAAAISSKPRFT